MQVVLASSDKVLSSRLGRIEDWPSSTERHSFKSATELVVMSSASPQFTAVPAFAFEFARSSCVSSCGKFEAVRILSKGKSTVTLVWPLIRLSSTTAMKEAAKYQIETIKLVLAHAVMSMLQIIHPFVAALDALDRDR